MTPIMQVSATYSTLSAVELLCQVVPLYRIEPAVSCEFWHRGLNDTYKVSTHAGAYILRVYRHSWRSLDAIAFEMESLLYLQQQGAALSAPIRRQDGEFITLLQAPEGPRAVVMTEFATGNCLPFDCTEDGSRFGQAAAQLHVYAQDLHPTPARHVLDAEHLLRQPLRSIAPHLQGRPEDEYFLTELAQTLEQALQLAQKQGLDWGWCHGDFHGGNAHDQQGQIVHFDFDCCGMGWRLFDLATFKWSMRLRQKEEAFWPAFWQGYRQVRAFNPKELELIEAFVALRDLWLFGLHTANAHDFACGWINNAYVDRRMKFLRDAASRMRSISSAGL